MKVKDWTWQLIKVGQSGELMGKCRESQVSDTGVQRCMGRPEARQVKLAARKSLILLNRGSA